MRVPKLISAMAGRDLWSWVIVIVLFTLVTALVSRPVENLLSDLLSSTSSPFVGKPDGVVVVAIGEDTLKQFPYRSPIDREFLAGVVAAVAKARPKAIGIDILFDQATEPAKDGELARVIAETVAGGVPVVIANAMEEDGLDAKQVEWLNSYAPEAFRGLATLARDRFDGVVREIFPGREEDGQWVAGFTQAMAGYPGQPADTSRRTMVYYRTEHSEPFAFPQYPAESAAFLPAEWFADKYVLIGVDLKLDDRHPTPFIIPNGISAGTLPGVVIHAHLLQQILNGDEVRSLAWPLLAALGSVAAILCWWIAYRPLPILLKPVAITGLLMLVWLIAWLSYSRLAIHVPVVAPTVVIGGVAALLTFLAWKRDSDERRFLQRAFSQYVSPAIVDTIVADPDSLKLGGERRTITCVFTDLEGFTSFSESLAPEEIAGLLNEYLDRMCNLFVEAGATIDKVVGDAVVGFFGAPTDQEDQANQAVGLALAIDRFSEGFRKELAARGMTLGVTRVGIHRGPAIVGNFGGQRFFDYTAIGDTVNTAARLEGANKHIGTRLCVSGPVASSAMGFVFRPIGTIFLKGKHEGIEAFEPVSTVAAHPGGEEAYEKAFALMKEGDPAASEAFSLLAETHHEDALIRFQMYRLSHGATSTDIILGEK
ncbi:MAG: adenylate/guanylate cyclase domain-containing protein [Nitratireductor sp.]|nr:adenylate/guanylate cyclase domain-containing protein [Nitratireductor sp.]